MRAVKSLAGTCIRFPLPLRAPELPSQQDLHRKRFRWPDCLLQEATFLVARRILLFWIEHGQEGLSTSLQSLPGPVSESPRSLTIGSDGWLLNIIVLRSLS